MKHVRNSHNWTPRENKTNCSLKCAKGSNRDFFKEDLRVANRCRKAHSTSLIVNPVGCCLSPVRMALPEKRSKHVVNDMEKLETRTLLVSVGWCRNYWKIPWKLSENLKLEPPYYPAIPRLDIEPKEFITGCQGTCIPISLHHPQ